MQSFWFYGLSIVAISAYAILPVLSKKMQLSVPPFTFIALTMTVLALLSAVAAFIFERSFQLSELRISHFSLLFLFGAINFVAFFIYLKALSGMPAGHYQLVAAVVSPLVVAFLAFFILSETVTIRFLITIPFLFAGLYIALAK